MALKIGFPLSLRQRTIALIEVAFLLTIIIIVIGIWVFIYSTEDKTWRERQTEATQNAAEAVTDYLRQNERSLDFLNTYGSDEMTDHRDTLQKVLRNNPSFLEIIFVDRNGNLVQGAAQGQAMLAGQVAMAQSKWFQAAKAGQKYYSGIQTSPQGVSYIIFAMPSIQGGVLAALIQMDELWETVADIRFGESGRVFVVNQAGRIIAHANRQYILAYRDISQTTQFKEILQASGQHWVGFTNNLEGMRVLSVSAIIKPTGWIVISELPHWELHATSRLALIVIPLGLFVLMLAVFFVFMRIFARDFLRPVEILREGALRLGQGDLSFRLEPPRVLDELGEVMAAFNKMAASLESQQDTLQLSLAYEYEVKRANELMRSSAMVLALSKVASLLGSSSSSELLLDTLGVELQKLGLECGVVTVDVAGEDATVKYLSFNPVLIRNVERLAGATIKNYVIPRRYWPDDRVLREKLPVWYSNPGEMMRGMFPQVAEPIAQKALQLLDIKVETQLCMLPLISREQIIGALTIWGVDLREEDGTVFAVFASQVAGILQNALAHENETRRANELARSNAMLLALSKVAARLESSADPQEIFDMVGVELKKIGIDTMIGLFDADKQLLRIQSLSVSQEAVRWAEKVTGRSLRDLSIPRRFWPTDKVVTEKAPY